MRHAKLVRGGVSLGFIVALILIPTSHAASVRGTFEVAGSIEIAAQHTMTSAPHAVFIPDATLVQELRLATNAATFRVFENSYLQATALDHRPMVGISTDRSTWTVHNATIHQGAERKAGWIGMHAKLGELTEKEEDPQVIERLDRGRVGNGRGVPDRDHPEQPNYLVLLESPFIHRVSNSLHYVGSGSLKLFGPTLLVESFENRTTIETGEVNDPSNPARVTLRWVVITFDEATLSLQGPAEVASESVISSWDGDATLRSATGSIQTPLRSWAAEHDDARITGALTGRILARDRFLSVELAGELRSSTMASQTTVAVPSGSSWLPVGIGIGLIVGGVGGWYYAARNRRQASLTPDSIPIGAEEYAQLAENAADRERFADALTWVERARVVSPTSRRLAFDHAFFLSQLGETKRAIEAIHAAAPAEDGEAAFFLARLYLQDNRIDYAAHWLCIAMEQEPILLFDAEHDADVLPLTSREDVKRAMRRASRALKE